MYETDIGAWVQSFPDGQKCQGLAHTEGKGSRSHGSLSFPGNGSLLQYVAMSGQDESSTLAHGA